MGGSESNRIEARHSRQNTGGPKSRPLSEDTSRFLKDLQTLGERKQAFEEKYGHELTVATMDYGYWQRYREKGVYVDLGNGGKLNPEKLRRVYVSEYLRALRKQPEEKQEEWINEFLADQDSLTEINPLVEISIKTT